MIVAEIEVGQVGLGGIVSPDEMKRHGSSGWSGGRLSSLAQRYIHLGARRDGTAEAAIPGMGPNRIAILVTAGHCNRAERLAGLNCDLLPLLGISHAHWKLPVDAVEFVERQTRGDGQQV